MKKFKLISVLAAMFAGHVLGILAHDVHAQRSKRKQQPRRSITVAKACTATAIAKGAVIGENSIKFKFQINCSKGDNTNCRVACSTQVWVWLVFDHQWALYHSTCTEKVLGCGSVAEATIGASDTYYWPPADYLISTTIYGGTCSKPGAQLASQMKYFEL